MSWPNLVPNEMVLQLISGVGLGKNNLQLLLPFISTRGRNIGVFGELEQWPAKYAALMRPCWLFGCAAIFI